MGKDWREELAKCFEDVRILESSKDETRENFKSFCEIIAVPAFESLKEELNVYKMSTKIQRVKGQSITFQINFAKSSICQFQYAVCLPKNSVQLELKLRTGGRKNKKDLLKTSEFLFMGGVLSPTIMDLSQEDLIRNVIEHYKNFLFASITGAE